MNHKQLLEHLAARPLAQAMIHDVSMLTNWIMLGPEPVPHQDVQHEVLKYFFRRWNCVFKASNDEVTAGYRDTAWVVAATTLHKYGFSDRRCTERALSGIDKLNKAVALSDYFFHHTEQAKALLNSPPIPLKRRPPVSKTMTLCRAGDILSYKLDNHYYAFYVHQVEHGNTAPLVEFYDLKLDRPPTDSDIAGRRAVGGRYNDGIRRIEQYWVYGMCGNPDMANQFKLVAANSSMPPTQQHIAPAVAGGAVIDIFRLQDEVDRSF